MKARAHENLVRTFLGSRHFRHFRASLPASRRRRRERGERRVESYRVSR
jgi:hypothetical protein